MLFSTNAPPAEIHFSSDTFLLTGKNLIYQYGMQNV